MSRELIRCPDHNIMVMQISQAEADKIGIEHGCVKHNDELRARPPVEEMTIEERVEELWSMDSPLWHSMDLLFRRMDELVGRPLRTHERIDFEGLEREIRGTPSTEDVVNEIREWARQERPFADDRRFSDINAKAEILDELEILLDDIENRVKLSHS